MLKMMMLIIVTITIIAVCVTLRFRAGGNDAIDGDTTEFGGSASR